ncbi:MAG: hypothetical protein P1U34_06305 [Coxiellaceae bacterium]|nr:hypothetical protein [Coxiellaceae bacterium]
MRNQIEAPYFKQRYHTPAAINPASCVGYYLKLHSYFFTVCALFRNYGGGVMFVYTVAGYAFGAAEDWSLGWKLAALVPGSAIGVLSAKPLFDYLHPNNTEIAKQLLNKKKHTLEITTLQVKQTTLKPWLKFLITCALTAASGIGAKHLTQDNHYGIGTGAVTFILSSLLSIKKTHNAGKICLYFLFSGLTSAILGDQAKIATHRLHEIIISDNLSPGMIALRNFIIACTVFVYTPSFIKSIQQNVSQFVEIKNQHRQRPWQQKELEVLFDAYISSPNAEQRLSYLTIEDAITDLRQRIFAADDTHQKSYYSVPHEYTLPKAPYAIHSTIILFGMFFFFNSGKNIAKDVIDLPNFRSVVSFALLSTFAVYSMQLYLGSKFITQYKTYKQMPRTTAQIHTTHPAIATPPIADEIPRRVLIKASLTAVISAIPPMFFTINARGSDAFSGAGALVTSALLLCLAYTQMSGKTGASVLRYINNNKSHSPVDTYIRGLIHILHQQPGRHTDSFIANSLTELAAQIRHAIDPVSEQLTGAAAPYLPPNTAEALESPQLV